MRVNAARRARSRCLASRPTRDSTCKGRSPGPVARAATRRRFGRLRRGEASSYYPRCVGVLDLAELSTAGPRRPADPPWCNGSTTAFGAVKSRFESWRRSPRSAERARMTRTSQVAVVILAAGAGTRMKSATPKVLHPLAGLPLIGHVLATADALGAGQVIAVLRHERDAIAKVIVERSPHTLIVDQDDVPGTGRAVEVALAALPADFAGSVVVLSADVPLLDVDTVRALLDAHEQAGNALTLLSAFFDDPTGAGRILRGADGGFQGIIEHRDADARPARDHRNQRRRVRVRRGGAAHRVCRRSPPATRKTRNTSRMPRSRSAAAAAASRPCRSPTRGWSPASTTAPS